MINRIPTPRQLNVTIREFYNEVAPLLNMNPEHQRLPVEINKEDKSESIIACMMEGISIGQITVHEIDRNNSSKKFQYESVDGGHRCRAIFGFKTNKFPLGSHLGKTYEGKYYCQLSDEDREYFDSIALIFTIYNGLSSRQLRKVFTLINTSDHINHQEGLNSAGTASIAKSVREAVRYMGRDIDNTPHILFEENNSNRGKREAVFMREINKRLAYDRLAARIFCVVLNGNKPTGCDDLELEDMYDTEYEETELDAAKIKVKKCLDFIFEIAQVRKAYNSSITIEYAVMLYRIYFSYTKKYKNWKINNFRAFDVRLQLAMSENMDGSFDLARTVMVGQNGKSTTTRSEVFKKCLRRHSDIENWNKTIEFLEETSHMNPDNLIEENILQIIHSRYISQNTKDVVLATQGHKDAIDGKDFAPEDKIEYDHILSVKNGGRSGRKNIQAVKKEHNRTKGCLNGDQYEAARSV